MELITVIVPVYCVEPYLDQCVESIVNQTYSNLEIILVDDGSPDGCPEKCDTWAMMDSRIKVIHKNNGGLSDARNYGLESASGEYISFVDSDDWLAPNFYEVLFNALQKEQAQISACSIKWAYDDHVDSDCNIYKQKVYTSEEAMNTLIQGDCFYAVVWNKLYSASLLEGIRFPVGKLHEDEFVTYKIMGRAKKLTLCVETEYFYRQRQGSIMQEWSIRHLDALEAFFERNEYLKCEFPRLYLKDKVILALACRSYYQECNKRSDANEGKQKILDYRRRIQFNFKELLQLDLKTIARLVKGRIYFEIEKIHFKKN